MILRQSEFARMCGVSDMAVSLGVKRGKLEKSADGRIDTENSVNKSYLKKHLKKSPVIKSEKKDVEFDIFSGLDSGYELGEKVYTQEGREAVKACKQLIKYIEQQEKALAMKAGIIKKEVEPCAVHFLQSIAERIVLCSDIDNTYTHDGMLMSMNEEYRLPYLQALGHARKKLMQDEKVLHRRKESADKDKEKYQRISDVF